MKSNPLLVFAAIAYFAAALPLLFAPEEILAFAGAASSPLVVALLQTLACALLGFAMLDWMSRFARIDGIFGRPLVVANLAHAVSAALLLGKLALHGPARPPVLLIAVAVYGLLAVGFGWAMFGPSPAPAGER
jgi:hypothetical protein